MAYALPVFFGWLADAKYGRFKMICWGVGICGIAHGMFLCLDTYFCPQGIVFADGVNLLVIMIISALPPVLTSGKAVGPFAFSLYLLAIGAAQVCNID